MIKRVLFPSKILLNFLLTVEANPAGDLSFFLLVIAIEVRGQQECQKLRPSPFCFFTHFLINGGDLFITRPEDSAEQYEINHATFFRLSLLIHMYNVVDM